MNDKEVKELMLQAYKMGDKEAAIVMFCFRYLPSIVAAFILLAIVFLVLLIASTRLMNEPTKPVTHAAPAQTMELEKTH